MRFNISEVLTILEEEVKSYQTPVVDLIAVQTEDPFKVLVATILSARTKDETTAKAAARLFEHASDVDALAKLKEKKIAELIYPVGFYLAKAGYLAKLPAAMARFNGQVPAEIDALVTLPGVGRKTANLVLAIAFAKPAICVDTHVHRIMNLWGYVKTPNPLKTEMALREKLPQSHWLTVNSILVAFGQGTCRPISPHCDRCVIQTRCPRIGVKPRKPPQAATIVQAKGTQLVSWNVNGIRAMEKKGFIDLVPTLGPGLNTGPDILALQETKAQPEQLSEQLKQINGYTAYWHSAQRKGYSGVAVYSRLPALSVIEGLGIEAFDTEGRVLTLEFDDFYLVNGYFPNAQHGLSRLDYKLAFNQALHQFVDQLAKKKSVVICGDFNVAHKAIDLKNPKSNEKNPGYSPEERQWMDTFIGAGYVDTFRKFHPEPDHYSWWSYRHNARARNIGWRIDYFCVDPRSEARVADADILNAVMGSDHCPVSLTFKNR